MRACLNKQAVLPQADLQGSSWPHPDSIFLLDWEPPPQFQWQLGRELAVEDLPSSLALKVIINGKLPYLKVIINVKLYHSHIKGIETSNMPDKCKVYFYFSSPS